MERFAAEEDAQAHTEVVELIRSRAAAYESPLVYMHAVGAKYAHTSAYHWVLRPICERMDGADLNDKSDENRPKGKALLQGGLLALRVADAVGGEELLGRMGEGRINVPIPRGDAEEEQRLKQDILDRLIVVGDETYAEASPYHELIEEWESVLIPSIADQTYLRKGFGIMLYLMHRARNFGAFEQQLAVEEHDWDGALAALMEAES